MKFKLEVDMKPAGDQPQAIAALIKGLHEGAHNQVLLGATGTGKTFTMANVIAQTNRSAVIMAPNKTLAAQLYEEMRSFFPQNAVEYFISFYDYYQPEAYIPQSDVFIEKDAVINEQIDRLRHSATRALLERKDVIVVCSVSCIYGLGDPAAYYGMQLHLSIGMVVDVPKLLHQLTEMQYKRHDTNFVRGTFRLRGDTLDIFPAHYEKTAWRILLDENTIERMVEFHVLNQKNLTVLTHISVFANTHYVTPRPTINEAVEKIKQEMKRQLEMLRVGNRPLEATRLERRVRYDLEMLKETGTCKGIEHYSRYLSGREVGEKPPTLFEYLAADAILFVDESHLSVPQVSAMYNGDQARKKVLVEYGFRLPSALDNRPLKFEEWEDLRPQTIFLSATPGSYELQSTKGQFIEQTIRPTGLVDPIVEIRPIASQIDDLIFECQRVIQKKERAIVTTLTKKTSEDLNEYIRDAGIQATYLHSEVKTMRRIEIIANLRSGKVDVLIGVNLLREGLDIPECSLVAILDGDKEGFLRSESALLQTIGRAARNVNGKVVIYADTVTRSIQRAIDETNRRRQRQIRYNEEHGIVPKTIQKSILGHLEKRIEQGLHKELQDEFQGRDYPEILKHLKQQMHEFADHLDFESAAKVRDKIESLRKLRRSFKKS